MKYWIRYLYLPVYLSVLFSFAFPGILHGQDISASEIEKFQQIRDSLILEGFILEKPAVASFQTASAEPEILNAWYTSTSLPVSTSGSRSTDFRSDGLRMYVVGRGTLNVAEYHLSVAWDIETASFSRELDISPEMGSAAQDQSVPHGLYFRKDDGSLMWVFNRTEIWEYTLSTPWDVTTATQTGYRDLSDFIIRGHDIDFKPDGTVLYVDDRLFESIFQFNLSEPWDVSTASLDFILDISDQQEEVRGIQFNSVGEKIVLTDTERLEVLEYSVSTPYDLRSASFLGSFSVASETAEPRGVTLKTDDKTFYITSTIDNIVHKYATYVVDEDESSVEASDLELQANGQEMSTITVILRDADSDIIPHAEINLTSNGGNSQIEAVQEITDSEGIAIFNVWNTVPEQVSYTATAHIPTGEVAINNEIDISFLPVTPVVLSATDIANRNFTANWEMVPDASSYRLDLSTDSDFNSFVSGYENLDVGFTTDYSVTEINPGTIYFYQVRAESNGLTSKNSSAIEVATFPDVPVASTADNVIATKFTSKWQDTEGAQEYLLDVATDPGFTNFVPGYQNLNVGSRLNHEVEGLFPDTNYYYRLRAQANSQVSDNSNLSEITTVAVGLDQSEIETSQLRVLANGLQENIITFILRDSNGAAIQGENVELVPDSGNSKVEKLQEETDENGRILFSVTNTTAEEVTYRTIIAETFEISRISTEFLPATGILNLGKNYPNPFNQQTTLPVTVPDRMNIRLEIVNVLGSSIKTVINEELNAGYYEIPVNMGGFASGVYFYRLFTDDDIKTEKMLLIN